MNVNFSISKVYGNFTEKKVQNFFNNKVFVKANIYKIIYRLFLLTLFESLIFLNFTTITIFQ